MTSSAASYGSDPDVALMLAVQADDPGAFEDLVGRFAGSLASFFYRQTGSRDLAEDLAQETFLKVYRARARYRPTARFRTWLLTIATNLCLNRLRYEGHRSHVSLDAPPSEEGWAGSRSLPDPGDEEPRTVMETDELRGRVRTAVHKLPENQRVAVVLHRFSGLSYAEIAESMDLSVKAVKSLLNRAKENLRERLTRDIRDYLTQSERPLVAE